MTKYYQTQAIIIKKRDYKENDRVFTVFTKENGKIFLINRGSKKIHSKISGHLELFYCCNIQIAKGRNEHITGAQIVNCFSKISKNYNKFCQASLVAEIVNLLIKEKEPSLPIFDLIYETLDKINNEDNKIFVMHFILQILSKLGHCPEVNFCVKCHGKLTKSNYFSCALGGIVCEDCKKQDLESTMISKNNVKIFRILLGNNFEFVEKIKISNENYLELRNTIFAFLSSILELIDKDKFFKKIFV